MTHETGIHPENVRLRRERFARRTEAFIVASCASFVLLSLIWPMSVTRFRSQVDARVRIGDSAGAEQEFRSLLASAVRTHMTDNQLGYVIAQAGKFSKLQHPAFVAPDFNAIRKVVSIRASATPSPDLIRVEIAFDGNGTADEKAFIQIFQDDITTALIQSAAGSDLESTLAIEAAVTSQHRQQFEKVEWLARQIQNDLNAARDSLAGLGTDVVNARPFRNASHASNTPRDARIPEVTKSLDAIDIAALRKELNHLKNTSAPSIDDAQQDFAHAPLPSTVPVGGTPSNSQLFLLGIVATVIGSVIAFNYAPFSYRGFESVSGLAARLRVPVIATIPKSDSRVDEDAERSDVVPWANRLTQIAKLVLLGFCLIVGVFCLCNGEVWVAFKENPFHGISRILRMVMGN